MDHDGDETLVPLEYVLELALHVDGDLGHAIDSEGSLSSLDPLLVPSHGLFVSRRPERQVPTTSRFQCLADAAAGGLDGLRKVMALRLGRPAPVVPLDTAARFVVIESA